MDDYVAALASYLDRDVRQDSFATAIQRSQAAVSRYRSGYRFPDMKTARLIDAATGGAVPFSLWQRAALHKLGLTDVQAEAA